ncbi:MAG: hypothetical protein ABII26_06535, partial [Pseudomonadota bacterium]
MSRTVWGFQGNVLWVCTRTALRLREGMIHAGLDKVVTRNGNGDVITHHVKAWVIHEDQDYG